MNHTLKQQANGGMPKKKKNYTTIAMPILSPTK